MDNRRSRVVINDRFQYQYALFAVLVSVLLVNLFVVINALLPGSQGYPLSTGHTMIIAGLEVLLIVGVWWGSLLASHKVAGPVYVIVRQMEKLAEGDLTARVKLRKNDMFKFEAVAINQCIEELQTHLLEIKAIASELEFNDGGSGEEATTVAENKALLIAKLNQKLSVFNFQ
jgi:methyl-accepting chemotaxis protein